MVALGRYGLGKKGLTSTRATANCVSQSVLEGRTVVVVSYFLETACCGPTYSTSSTAIL